MRLFNWLKEEWRLALAESWDGGVYHNRPTVQSVAHAESRTPQPFTREDPRCRKVELQQRIARNRLRLCGIGPRAPISAGWAHDERAFRFLRRIDG